MAEAATAAAAAFALYYFVKQRNTTLCGVVGQADPVSVPMPVEACRNVERPPNTWYEALVYFREVFRYMYDETLGRWHTVDLFVGLAYLAHRESSAYAAADIAAAGHPVSTDVSVSEALTLMAELREVRRYMLYCRGLKHKRPELQARFWVENLGIREEQIVVQQATAGLMRPAYVVVRDEELRALVLCIRGTQSMKDLFTSLTGTTKPHHYVDPDTGQVVLGYAHLGMLAAARWIMRQVVPALRTALADTPEYDLRIVGHSMGGGAAVLLTMLLRGTAPEFAAARCVAIACPACMTLELSSAVTPFVTSVINGTDIVPTFSSATVERLREEVTASSWFAEFQRDLRGSVLAALRGGWRGVGNAGSWTARNILSPATVPFRSCYSYSRGRTPVGAMMAPGVAGAEGAARGGVQGVRRAGIGGGDGLAEPLLAAEEEEGDGEEGADARGCGNAGAATPSGATRQRSAPALTSWLSFALGRGAAACGVGVGVSGDGSGDAGRSSRQESGLPVESSAPSGSSAPQRRGGGALGRSRSAAVVHGPGDAGQAQGIGLGMVGEGDAALPLPGSPLSEAVMQAALRSCLYAAAGSGGAAGGGAGAGGGDGGGGVGAGSWPHHHHQRRGSSGSLLDTSGAVEVDVSQGVQAALHLLGDEMPHMRTARHHSPAHMRSPGGMQPQATQPTAKRIKLWPWLMGRAGSPAPGPPTQPSTSPPPTPSRVSTQGLGFGWLGFGAGGGGDAGPPTASPVAPSASGGAGTGGTPRGAPASPMSPGLSEHPGAEEVSPQAGLGVAQRVAQTAGSWLWGSMFNTCTVPRRVPGTGPGAGVGTSAGTGSTGPRGKGGAGSTEMMFAENGAGASALWGAAAGGAAGALAAGSRARSRSTTPAPTPLAARADVRMSDAWEQAGEELGGAAAGEGARAWEDAHMRDQVEDSTGAGSGDEQEEEEDMENDTELAGLELGSSGAAGLGQGSGVTSDGVGGGGAAAVQQQLQAGITAVVAAVTHEGHEGGRDEEGGLEDHGAGSPGSTSDVTGGEVRRAGDVQDGEVQQAGGPTPLFGPGAVAPGAHAMARDQDRLGEAGGSAAAAATGAPGGSGPRQRGVIVPKRLYPAGRILHFFPSTVLAGAAGGKPSSNAPSASGVAGGAGAMPTVPEHGPAGASVSSQGSSHTSIDGAGGAPAALPPAGQRPHPRRPGDLREAVGSMARAGAAASLGDREAAVRAAAVPGPDGLLPASVPPPAGASWVLMRVPTYEVYGRIALCKTMVMDHLVFSHLQALDSVVEQLGVVAERPPHSP